MNKDNYLWWQKGIIYQIYPRSFQDSDGDGIGDIQGIIQRLDYLVDLGVNTIWLSPIFPSPMADFGYDVSDYTGIHEMFGKMSDFETLLENTHNKGLKVMLDLVPNHSSDQHPWFLESRSSKENPKRDWYIWKDPSEDRKEPNNWMSVFGGSGWEYDDKTAQYYYHGFLKEQPDLNWRNPDVQKAMLDVMDFWFKKGVDGFRIDVIWHMIKDEHFRDNPPNPDYREHMSPYNKVLPVYSTDQPEVHEIIIMMREVSDRYHERLLIGEIYLPINQLVTYYGAELSGVHLPFNFQLILLPWEPIRIYSAINEYEASIPEGGWPNWVLGNHDNPRIATKLGRAQARVAAMLLLTLRGTPTIYYGEELGMQNVHIPPELVQDPQEKNIPGLGLNRDPERTPMQWDDSENAGFTSGKPWLPLAPDFREFNVKAEQEDTDSFLSYYKKLIQLRQSEKALNVGDFIPVHADERLMAYERKFNGSRFLIVLNFTNSNQDFTHPAHHSGTIKISTFKENEGKDFPDSVSLQADEGIIVKLQ